MITEHLRVLADEIGPRGSCTQAERRAAEYGREYLASLGFESSLEPFTALTTFSWLHLTFFIMPLTAYFLRMPILAIISGILFFLDLNTIPVLSRLFPKGRSQNVYAFRGEVKGPEPIVLVAHLDSSKAGLNFSPRLVRGFRSSFLLMVSAVVASPALMAAASLDWLPWWPALLPCLYLAFASLTLVHREMWNCYTHGANDNASGVAAVLEIARHASIRYPGLDVRVLLSGCEEAGTYGMAEFLRRHGKELKRARFINLDNIGAGSLRYMSGEGMFPVFRATSELVRACNEVASRRPELAVSQGVYTLLSTDAMPALVRGYKAISFLAQDEEGLLPNWHWPTDTLERVDVKTVQTAVEFVSELVGLLGEADQ